MPRTARTTFVLPKWHSASLCVAFSGTTELLLINTLTPAAVTAPLSQHAELFTALCNELSESGALGHTQSTTSQIQKVLHDDCRFETEIKIRE